MSHSLASPLPCWGISIKDSRAAGRQVGALRISEDDRKEAHLDSAAAQGPEFWEEEVFIAQLHRRAQLLNQVRLQSTT